MTPYSIDYDSLSSLHYFIRIIPHHYLGRTMTRDILKDTEADTTTLHTIGQGFCGTVWASETGPAFKREDGGPHRSLANDFGMHQRTLQSFQKIPTLQIQIPTCDAFIAAENQKWWSANHQNFHLGSGLHAILSSLSEYHLSPSLLDDY